MNRLRAFVAELFRRKVVRFVGAYPAILWLAAQGRITDPAPLANRFPGTPVPGTPRAPFRAPGAWRWP